MGRVIRSIAGIGLIVNRNGPVRGDGQTIDQLFEVRAMVLGMPVGDERGPLAPEAAAARGAHTLDGLGMLVYQGAIAFKLWTGLEPSIPVMRQSLEKVFRT